MIRDYGTFCRPDGPTAYRPCVVLAMAAVLVVLVGNMPITSQKGPSELMQLKYLYAPDVKEWAGPAPFMLADSVSTLSEPAKDDWEQFAPKAQAVLQQLGLDLDMVANKTGLDEGCGNLMVPCIATVGACVSHHLVNASDKTVAADDQACQCFIRGISEPTPVPGRAGLQIQCSYQCMESLRNEFEVFLASYRKKSALELGLWLILSLQVGAAVDFNMKTNTVCGMQLYMLGRNGMYGERIKCAQAFKDMRASQFGSARSDRVRSQVRHTPTPAPVCLGVCSCLPHDPRHVSALR